MIAHGHIRVNGRKVDVSDSSVKVGDKIEGKNSEKSRRRIRQQLESNPNFTTQA